MEEEKTTYRNYLINQIKKTGQEIIERADEMISEDTNLISDFSILCEFKQDSVPTISWKTEVVTKSGYCHVFKCYCPDKEAGVENCPECVFVKSANINIVTNID